MTTDIRQKPTPQFIEGIRAKYRVERTVDEALTRKMRLRPGPSYSPVEPEFSERLTNFLKRRIDGPFEIRGLRPLAGGASKEQFFFELDWNDNGQHRAGEKMIVRRSPRESAVETHGLREFQLVAALDGVIPVPRAYWIDEDGSELERPTLIYGFVRGVQRSARTESKGSGIGTQFPPDLRAGLAEDFVEYLAKIHSYVPNGKDLTAFDIPDIGTDEGTLRTINWWARVWEEDRVEDIPLMAVAEQWLRTNAPILDHVSIIHGDYRAGNFLFDEATANITAILDWELGYLGDRHADLAWSMFDAFSGKREDGETLICGLLPRTEFLQRYEERSGLSVDPERLLYFNILELWKGIVLTSASTVRAAKGLKTHQNILLGWVSTVSYQMLESLRQLLGKEI